MMNYHDYCRKKYVLNLGKKLHMSYCQKNVAREFSNTKNFHVGTESNCGSENFVVFSIK
jgi:hypothetical protein